MTNHTLTAWGFTIAYALMVGLAILTMPHAVGSRVEVYSYSLLPCIVVGVAMIVYARYRVVRSMYHCLATIKFNAGRAAAPASRGRPQRDARGG